MSRRYLLFAPHMFDCLRSRTNTVALAARHTASVDSVYQQITDLAIISCAAGIETRAAPR